MAAVFRACFGYLFLILIVRIVGRRPGKQLTPFEFVLVFFIGGLALTAIVGDERSITNAICQILTIALTHLSVTVARARSKVLARLLDGTPLLLLEKGADGVARWRALTMQKMRIQDTDVMFAARDHGHRSFDELDAAILERNGDISVRPTSGAA